ncbi:blue light receptor [Rhizophlyctis rosea]|nr:blue light receptor [Rhizophlyctis rosea]
MTKSKVFRARQQPGQQAVQEQLQLQEQQSFAQADLDGPSSAGSSSSSSSSSSGVPPPPTDPTTMPLIKSVAPAPITSYQNPYYGIYSTSGFNTLPLLSLVASRPNPTVDLGPIDMSSSFIVVDAKSNDLPIVYASGSFEELTGYRSREILGRNCRFLQSPDGMVEKGSVRKHVDNNVVYQLKKSVDDHMECQYININYKKGGEAFVNLITIIPIFLDGDTRPTYFVGFQVDLMHQSKAILRRLHDNSYVIDFNSTDVQPRSSQTPQFPRLESVDATSPPATTSSSPDQEQDLDHRSTSPPIAPAPQNSFTTMQQTPSLMLPSMGGLTPWVTSPPLLFDETGLMPKIFGAGGEVVGLDGGFGIANGLVDGVNVNVARNEVAVAADVMWAGGGGGAGGGGFLGSSMAVDSGGGGSGLNVAQAAEAMPMFASSLPPATSATDSLLFASAIPSVPVSMPTSSVLPPQSSSSLSMIYDSALPSNIPVPPVSLRPPTLPSHAPVTSTSPSSNLTPPIPFTSYNLITNHPDLIHILSSRGIILFASPYASKKILNRDASALVGRNVSKFVHPGDLIALMRVLKGCGVGEGVECVFRIQKGSGEEASHGEVEVGVAGEEWEGDEEEDGEGEVVDLTGGRRGSVGSRFGGDGAVSSAGNGVSDKCEYIWMEVRGHKYEMKNRKRTKCFILSGRERKVGVLSERRLLGPSFALINESGKKVTKERERELWAKISPEGLFLYVAPTSFAVFGRGSSDGGGPGSGVSDLYGKSLLDFVYEMDRERVEERLRREAGRADGGVVEAMDMDLDGEDDEEDEEEDVRCSVEREDRFVPASVGIYSAGVGAGFLFVRVLLVDRARGSGAVGGGVGAANEKRKAESDVLTNASSSSSIDITTPSASSMFSAASQQPAQLGATPPSSSTSYSSVLTSSLDEDIFASIGLDRPTSLQYELNQLKMSNKRLMEELETLGRKAKKIKKARVPTPTPLPA